jgi:hypothetical protein
VAGLSLDYISAAPVFGYRNVSIDVTQSALYTEREGAKPYLLLFTPVTVLTDGVLFLELFIRYGAWWNDW